MLKTAIVVLYLNMYNKTFDGVWALMKRKKKKKEKRNKKKIMLTKKIYDDIFITQGK